MPHSFDEDPVKAFKRNVYVAPFHEDDISELIDAVGPDHLLFGSDFPHPEGLAEPRSYVERLPEDLPHDVVAGIMGGNLARIMRVPAGG
jgi:predicted TIM-barrel fold metal-dependent hydrolase